MKKNYLAFLLIAVFLCLACLVGCDKEDNPTPSVESKVTFTEKTLSLYLGETYQTTVDGLADGEKITGYESNNTSVLTVDDNGLVSTVAVGSATVKVKTSFDGLALLRMEVLSNDSILVPSIALQTDSVSLLVGDRYSVGYAVTFGKTTLSDTTVQWSSSDNTVATADNGVISALAEGTCTITATSTYNGLTATSTLSVSVENAGVAITTSIDNREIYVQDVIELYVYVTDSGVEAEVQDVLFETGNNAIAVVADNKLTAQSGGNVEITATFTYNQKQYSVTRNVYVYGANIVSVKAFGQLDHNIRGKVYGDKITLSLNKSDFADKTLKCWYVNGQKIDGNTFEMPDCKVIAEAKFVNQTEGNFMAKFAASGLYENQADVSFETAIVTDNDGKTNTDGNYVALKSAEVTDRAATRFSFEESVVVESGSYLSIRVYLTSGSKLYLGTEKLATCIVCQNATASGSLKPYPVKENVWTGEMSQTAEVKIPLTNFVEVGQFLSGVTFVVSGTCYIDYITVV